MLETQISQVAQQVATFFETPGVFSSQTEANPKGLINAIKHRVGKQLEDPIMKTKTIKGEVVMSRTASVRFYRSSKKRVSFQQGVVQFN